MKTTHQITGTVFCVTAAFLYAVNYLAAVAYAPNIASWPTAIGRVGAAYEAVGRDLQWAALFFLLAGILFLVGIEEKR